MAQQIDLSTEVGCLLALCSEVRSPVAWRIECKIRRNDWQGLASEKISPRGYVSAQRFLEDSQLVGFLKKLPGLPVAADPAQKALETMLKAERSCYETNERLSPLLYDSYVYGERLSTFLCVWRKKIKYVLGRAPRAEMLEGKFGPGSTFKNQGDEITVSHKLTGFYTATRRAYDDYSRVWDSTAWSRYAASGLLAEVPLPPFGDELVASPSGHLLAAPPESEVWPYKAQDFEYVFGNRFTTVAKTALTDRGICIEPALNIFYQLAVGKWLSVRMKKTLGWDKKTCQGKHRRLARWGSIFDSNATIDLSNASDTVAKVLVRLLLPHDWFVLLDGLRSTKTRLPNGRWLILEKFSSMGNGFTFELETLLFYTLCQAVAESSGIKCNGLPGAEISCFGDDIIVPKELGDSVVAALRFFGFEINETKSFLSGPFRESCGGDYFSGHDVRPYFLKTALGDHQPHKLISCANGLHRYYRRLNACSPGSFLSPPAPHQWGREEIVRHIPANVLRCRGPESLGDLVLTDDDPATWQTTVRNSIRYIRVWRPVMHRELPNDHWRPGVLLAGALYRAGNPIRKTLTERTDDHRNDGWAPRIRGTYVSGYRHGRVALS